MGGNVFFLFLGGVLLVASYSAVAIFVSSSVVGGFYARESLSFSILMVALRCGSILRSDYWWSRCVHS